MKIYQRISKFSATLLLNGFLLGLVFITIGSSATKTFPSPATDIENTTNVMATTAARSVRITANLNPNPPSQAVKLVFIHHSTGYNWLTNGNGNLGTALGANNYYLSETYYGWGAACPGCNGCDGSYIGSCTDTGHWWEWFRGENSDTFLAELYTTTNQYASYTRPMADPGGENEIIMFKSCFPNSLLRGNVDEPPTTGDNPLRGMAWNGQVDDEYVHTVGNAKGIYNDLLAYFRTRQDKLFIVVTGPPHLCCPSMTANARALNNWLMNDWLDDYPFHNVAVFDFFTVLTTNGGDPDTNDLGWSTGNHHRAITDTSPITIEHITTGDNDAEPNTLEYPTVNGTNPHPSSAGNQKATAEFVPLLNIYYNCWKYGHCLTTSSSWISLTAISDTAIIRPGEAATYTLSLTGSAGFTHPVTLTLQNSPPGASLSFVPNPVTSPATSTLTITTTSEMTPDNYSLTVAAVSDVASTTASITLTLTAETPPPILHLSAQPSAQTIQAGESAVYTLSLTSEGGDPGLVTLSGEGEPDGAGLSFAPNPVSPPASSALTITSTSEITPGAYPITIAAVSDVATTTASITLTLTAETPPPILHLSAQPSAQTIQAGGTAFYTLSLTSEGGDPGLVALSGKGNPDGSSLVFAPNPVTPPTSSTLTITTASFITPNNYLITLSGASPVASDTIAITFVITESTVPISVALHLSAQPNAQTIQVGGTAFYTISLTSEGGDPGLVALSGEGNPDGSSLVFAPNPVTPPATSALTISTTSLITPNSYLITLNGASPVATDTTAITLVITETTPSVSVTLHLSAQPSAQTIQAGATAHYTLSLTSEGGYPGLVALSGEGNPDGSSLVFAPNPVTPPTSSILTITTTSFITPNNYLITLSGASPVATDTTAITLAITETTPSVSVTLHLSARPNAQTIQASERTDFALPLSSANGSTGLVTLSQQGVPDEASAVFVPNSVTPPATSTLIVSTTSLIAPGVYTITITGASDTVSDTIAVNLIIFTEPSSFTLSVSPLTRSVISGQEISYTITVSGTDNFNEAVNLSVFGLPAGIETTWSDNPVMPNNFSVLSLSVTEGSLFGGYGFSVVGTASTQIKAKDLGLFIQRPMYPIYLPLIIKEV